MYQAKTQHPLSPPLPTLPKPVEQALWDLFVAIGTMWRFDDDVESYRLLFETFVQNRLALNPFYAAFYQTTMDLIANLAAQKNLNAAYELIFFGVNPHNLQYSPEVFQVVKQDVVNELINFRLACGSFRAWGAINYCTYFGGANLAGEPAPYRTAKGLK